MDAEKPPTFTVTIDFDPQNGHVNVAGPVENQPLFLGMLETAKMVVLQQRVKDSLQPKQPIIMPAPAGLNLRGN